MESPAAGAFRILHPTASPIRRIPLHPVNTNVNSPAALSGLRKKQKSLWISPPVRTGTGRINIKENHCALDRFVQESEPRQTSLGEELESIRRRRGRLQSERVRTEAALKEKDSMLERWIRELERRMDEQRNMELELRMLIKLKDLKSDLSVSSSVLSLRDKEQENKKSDAQREGTICSEMNNLVAESSTAHGLETDI